MGTAAGLASAGVTLAGGGTVKQALVAGAMGYIGGGGTVMGVSPMSAVGGFLPGAAGSALNTGLATGVIGAGIGKLSGMSTNEALRMGLTSGLSAAAMQGIDNARATPGKDAQFRSDFDATGAPPAAAPGANVGADGTISAPTIGTAQDLVAAAPQNAAMQFGPTPDGTMAPYDPTYDFNKAIGIDPAPTAAARLGPTPTGTMAPYDPAYDYNKMIGIDPAPTAAARLGPTPTGTMAPYDPTYDFNKAIGIDPASVSPSLGPSPTNIQIERGSLGMTGPIDTARQFVQEPINVGKDLYDTYLSPSRAGLPSDAGLIRKYAPLAAVGTLGAAALGAFEQEPAEDQPLFDTKYTGSDYIRDNPQQFQGGLDASYTRPMSPSSSVVPPTSFAPAIPLGGVAPVYMGGGITNSPGGVAQPYNVAGMYGVPLIYRAKGGEMTRTQFPRKTGPINGPGTGTSDDIPAMLSDGEFVFTAKAVRNAGKGSRRKGAARMYKLMKMLEGGPVKGK
jgi:hypothetical protein